MQRTNQSRGRFRVPARIGVAVSVAFAMAALLAPAAQAASIQVDYMPHSPMTLPQGEMWMADVMFTNTGTQTVSIMAESWIAPVDGSSPPVAFDMSMGSFKLTPGQTKMRMLMPTPSTWYESLGNFKIWTEVDGVPTGGEQVITVTAPMVSVPKFQDVTAMSGISVSIPAPAACVGLQSQGAATADVDSDGDLDIYLPNNGSAATLWINNGMGHFSNMAAQYGVTNDSALGHGASFADYDNDGDPDLYVTNYGMNRLYRNDLSTSGMFTDVTATAMVGGTADESSTSSSWADFDNDGYVDVYVTNYAKLDGCKPTFQYDRLYHNNGNGTFSDVTYVVEGDPMDPDDGNTKGAGFQAAWFDYNNDGNQDLYLANDWQHALLNPDHNRLFRNNGDGTFTDVCSTAGDACIQMNGMGIAVTDYDNDSDLDLEVSNMMGNVFLRNNGNGTFTDIAMEVGIDRMMYDADIHMTVFWGAGANDFNLDGSEDLYITAGAMAVMGDVMDEPQAIYACCGMDPMMPDPMYFDLSAPSHGDVMAWGRSPVLGDFDRDGRVDVFLTVQNGMPKLLRNVTPRMGNHFLYVDTVGRGSNKDGCGAKLAFTIGSKTRYREVFCGSNGLGSSNDPTVHVGTGYGTMVSKLVIKWPSGKTQVLRNLQVDRKIMVTEPA